MENLKDVFNTVINEMSNQAEHLKNSYKDFEEINLLELKLKKIFY